MITKNKPLERLLADLKKEIDEELKIDMPMQSEIEETDVTENLTQDISQMEQVRLRIEGYANLGLILPLYIATPNPNCPVEIRNLRNTNWDSKTEYLEHLGVFTQLSALLKAHDFTGVKKAYNAAITYFGLDKPIPNSPFYDHTEFQGTNNPQHFGFNVRYFIPLGILTQDDIDREELQTELKKRYTDKEEDPRDFERQKHIHIKKILEQVNKKTKGKKEYQGSISAIQEVLTMDTVYRKSDPTIVSNPDVLIDANHVMHKGVQISYSSENAHDLRLAPLLEKAVLISVAIHGKESPEFIQCGYSSLYNSRLHADLFVEINNSKLIRLVDSMTEIMGIQVVSRN